MEIDRHSVMAIAGVPATAYEMVRVLEHSFKYYRRTQLQELSFEGKLRAVSKLLKDNVPAALAGTGAVAPMFAGYDLEQESGQDLFLRYSRGGVRGGGVCRLRVRFPDDPRHSSLSEYLGRTAASAPCEEQSIIQALRLLTSAAEFDSATGGVNREANLYPVIKFITARWCQNHAGSADEAKLRSQRIRIV